MQEVKRAFCDGVCRNKDRDWLLQYAKNLGEEKVNVACIVASGKVCHTIAIGELACSTGVCCSNTMQVVLEHSELALYNNGVRLPLSVLLMRMEFHWDISSHPCSQLSHPT